ncbi:phosphatase PAP2 family protein [bacterium]|nr:phosphatase PAP2 family protein [bacterium]
MLSLVQELDTKLFFAMNSLAGNSLFDQFNMFLSSRNVWVGILLALVALTLWKGGALGKKLVLCSVIVVSFTDSFTYIVLKENIQRLRPCKEYKDQVITPSGCKSQFGFPSNHAANSAAIASTIYFVGYKAVGGLFWGIAILVGLSRIFLGVHYPMDVLFGLVSGGLYSFLIVKAVNMIIDYRKKKAQDSGS